MADFTQYNNLAKMGLMLSNGSTSDFKAFAASTKKADENKTEAMNCLAYICNNSNLSPTKTRILKLMVMVYIDHATPREKFKLLSACACAINATKPANHSRISCYQLAKIATDKAKGDKWYYASTNELIAEYGLNLSRKGYDKTYKKYVNNMAGELIGYLSLADCLASDYWKMRRVA